MNLLLDESIAAPYRSRSQKARVMTEDWVTRNLYCVRCRGKYRKQAFWTNG